MEVRIAPAKGGPGGGGGRDHLHKAERDALGTPNVVRHIEIVSKAARSEPEHVPLGAASMLLVRNEGGRRDIMHEGKLGGGSGGVGESGAREGGGIGEVKLTLRNRPKASSAEGATVRLGGRVRRGEGNITHRPAVTRGRRVEGTAKRKRAEGGVRAPLTTRSLPIGLEVFIVTQASS